MIVNIWYYSPMEIGNLFPMKKLWKLEINIIIILIHKLYHLVSLIFYIHKGIDNEGSKKSTEIWENEETYMDDITIVIVFF